MQMVKKVLKATGKVLLVVLVLAVVFVIGMTVIHTVITSKEKGELADVGYIHTVTVNGRDLNYSTYGKLAGEHVIVTISGLGGILTAAPSGVRNIPCLMLSLWGIANMWGYRGIT